MVDFGKLKIDLFTSPFNEMANKKLRSVLRVHGYNYTERAVTSDEELLCALLERFGDAIEFPGLLVDDVFWIPGKSDNAAALIREYVSNTMALEDEGNTDSTSSSGSSYHPGQELIKLPNGQNVTIADLIKELLEITPHQELKKSTYTMAPTALSLWESHFRLSRAQCVDFTRLLLQHKILHKVDGNFVLFPFIKKEALNMFLCWPPENEGIPTDARKLVISLSRCLDELIRQSVDKKDEAFQRFEQDICQLQVVADESDDLIFNLNLYNLMVRHANLALLSWPKTLVDLQFLFGKIGYNVAGTFLSIRDIQSRLVRAPLEIHQETSLFNCCKAVPQSEDAHFRKTRNLNLSVLLNMTWGIASTAQGNTVESLQDLKDSAMDECENTLMITAKRVRLPPIASWFRLSLGQDPQSVLTHFLPMLNTNSVEGKIVEFADADFRSRNSQNIMHQASLQTSKKQEAPTTPKKQQYADIQTGCFPVTKADLRRDESSRGTVMLQRWMPIPEDRPSPPPTSSPARQPSMGDSLLVAPRTPTRGPDQTELWRQVSAITLGSEFENMGEGRTERVLTAW